MVLLMITLTTLFFNGAVVLEEKYNNKFFQNNLDQDPLAKYLYTHDNKKRK